MPGPSLQERKRQVARDHIEAVALELFDEKGFAETTVDDIASAAGIASRTFFRYFATKEEVVFADHPQELARFVEALAGQPPGPLPTQVRRALAATRATDESRELEIKRRLWATVPAVRERGLRLSRDYEDAVAAHAIARSKGKLDPGDALMMAAAIQGAFAAIPEVLARGHVDGSGVELFDRAARLLEKGIR